MRLFVLDVEREADPDGAWIPMAVRMKLDLAGVKIRLPDWEALEASRRTELLATAVSDEGGVGDFAVLLDRALAAAGREPAQPLDASKLGAVAVWREPAPVPQVVTEVVGATGVVVDWARLDLFSRFCLHHYARRDDGERFVRALAELGS